jgi:hypothetical protein
VAPQDRTVEEKIAWIASRAWGVVTWRELRAAEISEDEIKWRAKIGALIRQYPGVYRVGHTAETVEARYMAAVKACGEGAVLSGKAAGYLWGLLPKCKSPPPPEVTTPTERRIAGIKTRRQKRMRPGERTTRSRIPLTTVPKTLIDLSSMLPFDDLARACHEAGVRYKTTPRHVQRLLDRRPNAPGSKQLRRVMYGEARVTLSKLEDRFHELLEEANLPLPITNRPAGGRRLDCRWPQVPLTVELDSYTYHSSRHAWEQDHQRRREAYKRGDQFRRYSYDDVFVEPEPMLSELGGLLAGAQS